MRSIETPILTLDSYIEYLNFSDVQSAVYIPVNLVPVSMDLTSPLTLDEERHFRAYGASLIDKAAQMLKQTRVVSATAQSILHRFYFRRAFQD